MAAKRSSLLEGFLTEFEEEAPSPPARAVRPSQPLEDFLAEFEEPPAPRALPARGIRLPSLEEAAEATARAPEEPSTTKTVGELLTEAGPRLQYPATGLERMGAAAQEAVQKVLFAPPTVPTPHRGATVSEQILAPVATLVAGTLQLGELALKPVAMLYEGGKAALSQGMRELGIGEDAIGRTERDLDALMNSWIATGFRTVRQPPGRPGKPPELVPGAEYIGKPPSTIQEFVNRAENLGSFQGAIRSIKDPELRAQAKDYLREKFAMGVEQARRAQAPRERGLALPPPKAPEVPEVAQAPTGTPARPVPAPEQRVTPEERPRPAPPTPTVPEAPETLARQWEAFERGDKPAVLFPPGEMSPVVEGYGQVLTDEGMVVYHPQAMVELGAPLRAIGPWIRRKFRAGEQGLILGYGIEAKPPVDEPPTLVETRGPAGEEVQTIVAPTPPPPEILEAAERVLPEEGGEVIVSPPEEAGAAALDVLGRRLRGRQVPLIPPTYGEARRMIRELREEGRRFGESLFEVPDETAEETEARVAEARTSAQGVLARAQRYLEELPEGRRFDRPRAAIRTSAEDLQQALANVPEEEAAAPEARLASAYMEALSGFQDFQAQGGWSPVLLNSVVALGKRSGRLPQLIYKDLVDRTTTKTHLAALEPAVQGAFPDFKASAKAKRMPRGRKAEAPPEAPAAPAVAPPAAAAEPEIVGQNEAGQTIHLDKRGARYLTEKRVRTTQPVRVIPGGYDILSPKTLFREGHTEYLTPEEIQGFRAQEAVAEAPAAVEPRPETEAPPARPAPGRPTPTAPAVPPEPAIAMSDRVRLKEDFGNLKAGTEGTVTSPGAALRVNWDAVGLVDVPRRVVERLGRVIDVIESLEIRRPAPGRRRPEPPPEALPTPPERPTLEAEVPPRERAEEGVRPEGERPAGDVGRVGPPGPGVLGEGPPELGEVPPGEQPARPGAPGGLRADRGGVEGPPGAGPGLPGRVGERPGGVALPAERGGPGARPGQLEPTGPPRHDYRITAADRLGQGSPRERYQANLAAIRLLKQLEAEGRPATPSEQAILVRYVGWGGMPQAFDPWNRDWQKQHQELKQVLTDEEWESARASTPNAHYTEPDVIAGIYHGLRHLGFKQGRILEPAAGIGHFLGLMPQGMAARSARTAIELDTVSGRIAKQLYQSADVRVEGYEEAKLPDNFYDVAVSNVPFGDYKLHDPRYNKLRFTIHNYFFAKTLDKVRPGGVIAFITSHYTMDAKDPAVRRYIAERADLLGAIRLPNTAFKGIAQTEVTTDIIILGKRPEGMPAGGQSWIDLQEVPVERLATMREEEAKVQINEYFARHPEMMLGKMALTGTLYRKAESTLEPDGRELGPALREAMERLPAGLYTTAPVKGATVKAVAESLAATGAVKPNAFTIQEGKVYVRDGEQFVPAGLSADQEVLVRGMIRVRDAAREVLRRQLEDQPDADVQKAQHTLEALYDRFVAKYGPLSSRKNYRIYRTDPDSPFLLSLEDYDADTGKAKKTDIFTKRTVARFRPVEKVGTAQEALLVSLNELGAVDWERMSALTGTPQEALQAELKGLVYRNPEGGWEVADAYLSGNVRRKLEAAEAAAKTDPTFRENVEALRRVQPKDLEPGEIQAQLGATWIPPEDVVGFVEHLSGARSGDVAVRKAAGIGTWTVDFVSRYSTAEESVANTRTWGTPDVPGHKLVEHGLNQVVPTVYYKDAEGNRILDQERTTAARDRLEAVKEEFGKWLWGDPERAQRLAKVYNWVFNSLRDREYDGAHLTLPGASPAITLRAHQKNAIWRVLQGGNALLAHVVGSGKTFIMVAAGMEMRRLGLARKPIYVIPNHLVDSGQFAADFLRLYPGANILSATREDFEKGKRQQLMSRIATGDWDAVIVAHSSFGKLPVSKENYARFVREQIRELEEHILSEREADRQAGRRRSDSRIVKQLEKAKKRLEAQLKEKMAEEEKDVTVTWEEVGVDAVFVDEAHLFKNLFFPTKMTRIAGLGGTASERATDLFIKSHYLLRTTNGRNLVFATGTPLSNTLAEMFTMQRYLQMASLRDLELTHFDSWAGTFAQAVTSMELAPEGQRYRAKMRFSRFVNVPELLAQFRSVADIQTKEMLKLPTPKIAGGKPQVIESPGSPALRAFVAQLGERAERVRRGGDPTVDNMLKITGDGRKAALDMRLVDPGAREEPEAKINQVAAKVEAIWRGTAKARLTQIVFADLSTPTERGKRPAEFNFYHDLKRKLVGAGVPAPEIAFIHDPKNDAEKRQLFRDVNAGKVRILVGSTEKMGVGTNVQQRLLALHHVDVPWRPSDIEQREGRILRQGNTNAEVHLYHYVTTGSFDAYIWQLQEAKAGFIDQIMRADATTRVVEDIEARELTPSEVKAIATGNPVILEKVKADAEIRKLQSLLSHYERSRAEMQRELATLPQEAAGVQARLSNYDADIKRRNEQKPEEFRIALGGKVIGDRAEAGAVLIREAERLRGQPVTVEVGEYAGFRIAVRGHQERIVAPDLLLTGAGTYSANVTENPAGTIQSLEARLRSLDQFAETARKAIEDLNKRQAELQKRVAEPFQHAERLKKALAKAAEVNKALGIGQQGPEVVEIDPDAKEQPEADAGEEEAPEEPYQPAQIPGAVPQAPGPSPGQPVRLAKARTRLVERLHEVAQIPVRVGRIRGRRTIRGVFKTRPEVIRTRIAGDIQTLAHELGHYVSLRLFGPTLRGRNPAKSGFFRTHAQDLDTLAQTQAKPSREEGFAEFWRLFVTDEPDLRSRFQALYQDLVGRMERADPELLGSIRELGQQYRAWRSSDEVERLSGHVAWDPEETRPDLRETMARLYTGIFSEFHPVAVADAALAEGRQIPADQSAAALAQTLAGIPELLDLWVFKGKRGEGGVTDFHTRRKVAPSLEEALEPVLGQWKEWSVWMIARRMQELAGRTDDRARRQTHALRTALEFDEGSADRIVARLDSPGFRRSAELYQQANDAALQYLVDAGLLAADAKARIQELNRSYFPFYRFFGDREPLPSQGASTVANQRSPVKGMKGSGRPFDNPLQNAIRNLYLFGLRAERNAVARTLAELAERVQGGGSWMERVPTPASVSSFQLEEIRKAMEAAGIDPEVLDAADLETLATVFRPDRWRTQENEVWVMRQGKPVHYIVEPNLYRAMLAIDRGEGDWITQFIRRLPNPKVFPLQAIVDAVVLGPPRLLRLGATRFSPEFLLRNPFRDAFVRAAFTRVPSRLPAPLGPWSDLVYSYSTVLRGFFSVLRQDAYYDAFIRGGGAISALASLDRARLARDFDDLIKGRRGVDAKTVLKNPIQWIGLLNRALEEANRVEEGRAILDAKGARPETATKGQLIEAALGAREVTIDFSRSGAWVRFLALNRLTAFFNANLQGWDKMFREMRRNPSRFLTFVLSTVTFLSVLLWYWNHEDPRWGEIPQWQKDISWVFLMGAVSKEQWAQMGPAERRALMSRTVFRVPKPWEIGVLFGSIPERILDWMVGQNPEILTSLGKSLTAAVGTALLPIPTMLEPVISNMVNWSRFFERPVVPRSLEGLEPTEQYGPGTSEVAIALARGFASVPGTPEQLRSPMKVDNLLRSWFGGFGRLTTDVVDAAIRSFDPSLPPAPTRTWADVPGIRGFIVRFPTTQAESIDQFYGAYEMTQVAARTVSGLRRMRRGEEAYADAHAVELLAAPEMRRVARVIANLRKELREVQDDRSLAPEAKRLQTDNIVLEMIREAQEGLGHYRQLKEEAGRRPAAAASGGAR